jgi:hypothetical protein
MVLHERNFVIYNDVTNAVGSEAKGTEYILGQFEAAGTPVSGEGSGKRSRSRRYRVPLEPVESHLPFKVCHLAR